MRTVEAFVDQTCHREQNRRRVVGSCAQAVKEEMVAGSAACDLRVRASAQLPCLVPQDGVLTEPHEY